jgi:hypothetical protein
MQLCNAVIDGNALAVAVLVVVAGTLAYVLASAFALAHSTICVRSKAIRGHGWARWPDTDSDVVHAGIDGCACSCFLAVAFVSRLARAIEVRGRGIGTGIGGAYCIGVAVRSPIGDSRAGLAVDTV